MRALRTSSVTARLILAWFLLVLGVAGASPIVQPKAMEVVCAAGGSVKVIAIGDDGQEQSTGQRTLDCSLCLVATLPAPQPCLPLAPPQFLATAPQPVAAARVAALVGPPLPPRGPPVSA